jgi:hypothetical protein
MSKNRKAVSALVKKVSENAELVDVIELEKEKLEESVLLVKLELGELEKKEEALESELISIKNGTINSTPYPDPVTIIMDSISKIECNVNELESILDKTIPKLYFNVAGIDKLVNSLVSRANITEESLSLLLSRLENAEKAVALLSAPKGSRRAKKA